MLQIREIQELNATESEMEIQAVPVGLIEEDNSKCTDQKRDDVSRKGLGCFVRFRPLINLCYFCIVLSLKISRLWSHRNRPTEGERVNEVETKKTRRFGWSEEENGSG